MQDIIERVITVKAPRERIYKAISQPEEIVKWFPDALEEGTLEVGQNPVFTFNGHGKARIHVEAARPVEYFAYRWIPGSGPLVDDVLVHPNTLVEFFIEELAEGTKITVKESGFASLPADVAEEKFKQNSGGWEFMIARLEKLIQKD